jgi:hypothetical protein
MSLADRDNDRDAPQPVTGNAAIDKYSHNLLDPLGYPAN